MPTHAYTIVIYLVHEYDALEKLQQGDGRHLHGVAFGLRFNLTILATLSQQLHLRNNLRE